MLVRPPVLALIAALSCPLSACRCSQEAPRAPYIPPAAATAREAKKKLTSLDLAQHPVRHLAYWQDRKQLERPLEARVEAAPPELVEYLRMDNQVNGYTAVPQAVPLAADLRQDIMAVFPTLPAKLQAMLSVKLLGIFAVSGLGSSAYTDFVRDAKGLPAYAFICVDPDAMNRKANDWLSWKENTPFQTAPSDRLEAQLEPPESDTRQAAVAYVLTHEFGHAVAFASDVHPLWSLNPDDVDPEDYPFMNSSWVVKDGHYRPKNLPPPPGLLVYYKTTPDRPSATQLGAYYDWLQQSSFVDLYAATNPFDDFAESLVSYIHTEVQHKPFFLRLYHDGALVRTVPACWQEPRCSAKRALIEAFLR